MHVTRSASNDSTTPTGTSRTLREAVLQAGLAPQAGLSAQQQAQLREYHAQVQGDVQSVRQLGFLLPPPLPPQTPKTQQEVSVELALQSGQSAPLINAEGRSVAIQVRRMPPETREGVTFDVFQLQLGNHSLLVKVDQREQSERATSILSKVANWLSMIPAAQQSTLREVVINSGPNPADEYWRETYQDPNFTSAATAGNGRIDFWNGASRLQEGTFNHEMGHLVGERLNSPAQRWPQGWEEAMRGDPPRGSHEYGSHNAAEDFAEAFREYMDARMNGREAMRAYRERYPNRSRILDQIFDGTLTGRPPGLGGLLGGIGGSVQ